MNGKIHQDTLRFLNETAWAVTAEEVNAANSDPTGQGHNTQRFGNNKAYVKSL